MKKINLIIGCITLFCVACSSDDNGNTQPANQPPSTIILDSPANNATAIDKNVSFVYDVPDGDPEGDTIVYDIYLNNGIEEVLIAENHNEESFNYQEPLGLNRNYTWRVVAKDGNGGETESEPFAFTTRKANYIRGEGAGYLPRRGHTTVLFNDRLVIMSGRDAGGLEANVRQSQNGLSWVAAPSELPVRIGGASVVYDSKIYTVGGFDSSAPILLNDVYELSDLAGVWAEVTVTEGFTPRFGHSLEAFNGAMYMIGGAGGAGVGVLSEVLTSSDGATWTTSNAVAQFGQRAYHTSVVFNNKIWVIGGISSFSDISNDVWSSSDGIDWVLETAEAGFSPRNSHSSVVYDNKIWVYGGLDDVNDTYFGDLWYSEDGINWYEAGFEVGEDLLPENLRETSLAVKNVGGDEYMYVIGGRETNEAGVDNYISYALRIN